MTPVERLFDRLRAMGLDVPDGSRFHRTHAGYWQRAQGAWSWFIDNADGRELYGSQVTVTELLRWPEWVAEHEPHAPAGVLTIDAVGLTA